MSVTVKICKFNPGVDSEPYYITNEVPWHEDMSVLEAVRYVHDEIEPVSFDYCCRAASCGLCGMKVDGVAVLACIKKVEDESTLTVDPLDGFPVIRDLIVDRTKAKNKILANRPAFSRDMEMTDPVPMSRESVLKTSILQQCRECLLCTSSCPVVQMGGMDYYAGPTVMARIASRYYDEREGKAEERLAQAVEQGLQHCIQCGTCTSVCPKGDLLKIDGYEYSFIDHVRYWKEMLAEAEEKGLLADQGQPTRPLTLDDIFLPQASDVPSMYGKKS